MYNIIHKFQLINYFFPCQGPHSIDVTYENLQIPKAPFKTNVVPGCDPTRVKAYGPGKIRLFWLIQSIVTLQVVILSYFLNLFLVKKARNNNKAIIRTGFCFKFKFNKNHHKEPKCTALMKCSRFLDIQNLLFHLVPFFVLLRSWGSHNRWNCSVHCGY